MVQSSKRMVNLMSQLFIIGNGFDLDHKLPTRYENFHDYLRAAYPNASEEFACVPMFQLDHHGEEVCDDDEIAGYLMSLFSRTDGDKWSHFEETLGCLDFDEDFSELPPQYDRDGDRNLWHELYNNEDLASRLVNCIPYISRFFSEWINTIDVSSAVPKPRFECLIQPDDVFLNFNYTKVLEQIYKIPKAKICHIHGVQGQREELIFGHGEGNRFDEDHFSPYIGCEDGLEAIQAALRKDTDLALQTHQAFFKHLSSGIHAIYSYGFSFSKVDEVYLREICSNVDTTKTVWFQHSHTLKEDPEEHERHRQTILRCGFKGSFDLFDT